MALLVAENLDQPFGIKPISQKAFTVFVVICALAPFILSYFIVEYAPIIAGGGEAALGAAFFAIFYLVVSFILTGLLGYLFGVSIVEKSNNLFGFFVTLMSSIALNLIFTVGIREFSIVFTFMATEVGLATGYFMGIAQRGILVQTTRNINSFFLEKPKARDFIWLLTVIAFLVEIVVASFFLYNFIIDFSSLNGRVARCGRVGNLLVESCYNNILVKYPNTFKSEACDQVLQRTTNKARCSEFFTTRTNNIHDCVGNAPCYVRLLKESSDPKALCGALNENETLKCLDVFYEYIQKRETSIVEYLSYCDRILQQHKNQKEYDYCLYHAVSDFSACKEQSLRTQTCSRIIDPKLKNECFAYALPQAFRPNGLSRCNY